MKRRPDVTHTWVTSEVVAEAQRTLEQRQNELSRLGPTALSSRVGQTLVTESVSASGMLVAIEELYVDEDGLVRVFSEVFAKHKQEWSRVLVRGDHVFDGT